MGNLRQRPTNFVLNNSHSLACGLVFAGLGRSPRSVRYTDSSPYGRHGTLTNMEPATDWVWMQELNRFALDHDNTNDHVAVSESTPTLTELTFCCWVNRTSSAGNDFMAGGPESDTGEKWGFLSTNQHYIRTVAGGTARTTSIGYAAGNNGTWNHIAVTATNNGSADAFLNGVRTNIIANIGTVSFSLRYIGYDGLTSGGNPVYSNIWLGRLADFVAYSRVLSNAEIQQLADPFNVMLSGLIQPPKRKYYGFNITSPTTLKYLTFKSNNRFLVFKQ